MAEVRRSHYDRPNPDEPWRYRCPECRSVNLRTIIGGMKIPGKQYAANGIGKQDVRRDQKKRYYCRKCQTRVGRLWDAKIDQLIDPDGVYSGGGQV